VESEIQRYVAVRYDGDRGEGAALGQRFGVDGYPTFVMVDAQGRKIDEFSGYRGPDELIARLRAH
jgi:thioredoxin-related protein